MFPALIAGVNLLLWLFFFKLESFKSCLTSRNEIGARLNVQKIYKAEDENGYEQIYQELLNNHNEANASKSKPPGYGEVLCNPQYCRATWLVMSIAFFNQMSGVNLISIYSTKLFQDLSDGASDGGFSISPGTGSALVGVF